MTLEGRLMALTHAQPGEVVDVQPFGEKNF